VTRIWIQDLGQIMIYAVNLFSGQFLFLIPKGHQQRRSMKSVLKRLHNNGIGLVGTD